MRISSNRAYRKTGLDEHRIGAGGPRSGNVGLVPVTGHHHNRRRSRRWVMPQERTELVPVYPGQPRAGDDDVRVVGKGLGEAVPAVGSLDEIKADALQKLRVHLAGVVVPIDEQDKSGHVGIRPLKRSGHDPNLVLTRQSTISNDVQTDRISARRAIVAAGETPGRWLRPRAIHR